MKELEYKIKMQIVIIFVPKNKKCLRNSSLKRFIRLKAKEFKRILCVLDAGKEYRSLKLYSPKTLSNKQCDFSKLVEV